MTLSRDQAAEALRDVERSGEHSATVHRYQKASPYLLLWGPLWAVGYTLTDCFPQSAGPIWLATDMIGFAASIFLAVRAGSGIRHAGWRTGGLILAFMLFIAAGNAVIRPTSVEQAGAFPALIIGFSYMLAGTSAGFRIYFLGIILTVSTVGAYVLLPAHFSMWIAVIGSATLVLGGLWLRKV